MRTFLYFNHFSLFCNNSAECDYNRTLFIPEGRTATFLYNFTDIFPRLRMEKTSGSTKGLLFSAYLINAPKIHTSYHVANLQNRSSISIPSYSDHQLTLKIDLTNISMEDNGTYRIRGYGFACYIIYVMRKYRQ
jgi:hypothetical protein